MKKKTMQANFDELIASLAAQGFDVAEAAEVAEGKQVSKHGVAAVLVPGAETPLVFAVRPGVLFRGQICRLMDRGFQKFFVSNGFEMPATAGQLEAVHRFGEEVRAIGGAASLYNESLGTTSDLYHYDRPKYREAAEQLPARPWETAASH